MFAFNFSHSITKNELMMFRALIPCVTSSVRNSTCLFVRDK